MRTLIRFFSLLAAASFAYAAPKTADFDPFVTALEPCLEYVRKDASGVHHQLSLNRGWLSLIFPIAAQDGGGLGTDLCGELGAEQGGPDLSGGSFEWPASLGQPKELDLKLVTAKWLEHIIAQAKSASKQTGTIERVTLTALPEAGKALVRVYFSSAEAEPQAQLSVDLNLEGAVIARDVRVPDQLSRRAESSGEAKAEAEATQAPTVDPKLALDRLMRATQAAPNATILRVTLTNFDAALVYRNTPKDAVRHTRFDFTDGQARAVRDEIYEVPPSLKLCAMKLIQVQNAISKVAQQNRYIKIAKRLQYFLLECSDLKPKPHWSLVAMEPFEYFDLPAEL